MKTTKKKEELSLRNINLKDASGKVRDAPWREQADLPLGLGDCLQINNVIVNEWDDKVYAGSISSTQIEVNA